MEPRKATTSPYPETNQSAPRLHMLFHKTFILILSFHRCLGLPSAASSSRFSTKLLYVFLVCSMWILPETSSSLIRPLLMGVIFGKKYICITELLTMRFLVSCFFLFLRRKYSSKHPVLSPTSFRPLTSENNFFTKTKQLVKIWFCLFTLNVFR